MTIKVAKFTPEVLLSAPRRSAALPNNTGEKALYTVYKVSTYSFEDHKKTLQIRLLDIQTGQSESLYEDLAYSEPVWVGEHDFVFLKSGDKGCTSLMQADVQKPGSEPHEIRCFNGGLSNVKVKELPNGTYAIACSALATPHGHMHDPEAESKPRSSARVYTSLFVRHWDAYVSKEKSVIWYGNLKRAKGGSLELQDPGLVNALDGTGLESPVPPFGGSSDFDISATGLVFVAKDPKLNQANYTKTDLYYVKLKTFTEPNPPAPQIVRTGVLQGYSATPVFSHDGTQLAFTRMRSNQYESDKPRILLIRNIRDLQTVEELHESKDGEGHWDSKPESLAWAHDDSHLYAAAEWHGRALLWLVPIPALIVRGHQQQRPARVEMPAPIFAEGSVSDFHLLRQHDTPLLVTSTSLVDSSAYYIVNARPPKASSSSSSNHTSHVQLVSSHTKLGRTFGLSRKQVDEFYVPSRGGDYRVHALVMRPSNFDASKRYPLAFLIHGGPQGAWLDSWSTRWNPAVFAEQGYVAVMPNPTGSSGYGMALQDGIRNEWGGRPYDDLVRCFEYISANMPYVDTDRAVALGASYGGYMINWIQGHPLGRKFKALVCHDGVFSTLNQYSSEELFFPIHDFGGTLWDNRPGYERWDPARFINNWSTPQLIVHSELDYRLPITEGLAPFNILQSKGIPSRLLMFPDENHWVLKPENSLVWHREVLDWINKYSGIDTSTVETRIRGIRIS